MNWNVFFTRAGSAVIYALVMVAGLWLSEPLVIFILGFLILFLTNRELFPLTDKLVAGSAHHWTQWMAALLLGIYFVIAFLDKQFFTFLPLLALPVIIFSSLVLIPLKYRVGQLTILINVLYLAIPVAAMIDLRGIDRMVPLLIIIMIWINDTMAYIIGSFIGKTPLSIISPKKTWEGTIGGIILTAIVGLIFGLWAETHYAYYHWAALAGIVAIFGNLGDLLESLLKRMANVKDSGNIMPGHGGALDRLDSFLAVFPVALVYFYLFMK